MYFGDEEVPDRKQLPWKMPEIPPGLHVGKWGDWYITEDTPPLIRGYFRGLVQPEHRNYILLKEGQTRMSLTPMELESMAPYVAAAHGHVVVVGAGMGVYLYNVLEKPEVTEVTLSEKDEVVREMLDDMGLGTDLYPDKLSVIHKDALEIQQLSEEVDFLYVDIWELLMDGRALAETSQIWKAIQSKEVAYWGQELDLIHWLHMNGYKPPVRKAHVKKWKRSVGLPLHIMPSMELWAMEAARNVASY